MPGDPVLSRHRLPRFYRLALTGLWLTPVGLLAAALVVSRGVSPSLADPRLALPLLLMLVPALYIWREGVDVLPGGIVTRVHFPRYYGYAELDAWSLDHHPQRRVLTVWTVENRKALEYHAAHLTDLPLLLAALHDHVRCRDWPY